ncbi:MAG: RNA polymerase sigma factor [Phycisphaerales bacterium]
MDHRDDHELVAAANAGDRGAFDALYARHRDWTLGLAGRHTGDEELALDVMQDAWLWLLRKFPGFELRAHVKSVLYPVVVHLARDARARRRTRRAMRLDAAAAAEPAAATPERTGDDAARTANALAAAIDRLPPETRDALILRYVDELSLADISVALQIPVGTVKSRLHNGLRRLRENSGLQSSELP